MEPYQVIDDIIIEDHPMDYTQQITGITRELKRMNDEGNKNAIVRGVTDAVLSGVSGIAGSAVSTLVTSLLLHKLLKTDKPENID